MVSLPCGVVDELADAGTSRSAFYNCLNRTEKASPIQVNDILHVHEDGSL